MSEIKAIQTKYKGYLFRSRLEARWAVFFDCCGVEYEYEPEGYDLGNGLMYLPDFLLHGVDGRDGKSLTWNDLPEVEKHNLKGENGAGVNVGGTKGQVLTKASANDFDTYWQDLAFTKKSYNGVIAPNAYKEINTGIPARNIIVDVKVKDTTSNSETSGFYINAQNLSTVAITDNRIRIFNEYSTNLEFLITTLVLNNSEIIAI